MQLLFILKGIPGFHKLAVTNGEMLAFLLIYYFLFFKEICICSALHFRSPTLSTVRNILSELHCADVHNSPTVKRIT